MAVRAGNFGKRAPLAPPRAVPAPQPAAVVPTGSTANVPSFLGWIPWFTLALSGGLIIRYLSEIKAATDFAAPGAPGHHSLLALKPVNMSHEEAAAVLFGGCTALHFLRKAGVRAGQNVLIYGASGSVGVFAVQLAKELGARVTGVCSTANVDMVRALGADAVVDYTREDYSAAGRAYGVRNIDNTLPGAYVVAHENVTLRLSKAGQTSLIASETYFGSEKKLNFVNGEGVVVTHPESAHTDGDSIVYFRGSDVIAAGDLLDMTKYPVIDLARGGSIQGVVDALNWILDVTVVEHMMEGGTLVVPGHGRMTDAADVAYYRVMATIMRDRVREMMTRGMTLPQIKAARLTRDYDGRFGKSPSWTPDMFVEAIYRSLNAKS